VGVLVFLVFSGFSWFFPVFRPNWVFISLTMGSSCLYSAQLESTSDICVRHFEVPSLIPRPVFHK
jgi:hypothetical protein